MCTEAQLGKDQLDCHFAWITECFKAYLNKEGNNLKTSEDMFIALTDPSFDIANTHVLYGSTAHPPLQKKFRLQHLKVHQVHEYSYIQLGKGVQKVEVAYHGGVLTPQHTTTENFKTSDARYVQWMKDANFEVRPWKMERIHVCRSAKLQLRYEIDPVATIRCYKQNYCNATAFQEAIVRHAHAWASVDYAGDGETTAAYLKLPEDCETTKIKMETKGWARKKQTAKVLIPHDIKKSIADLFNKRPRLSPAQAFEQLKKMEVYTDNHFVQHIMNEARVHAQFSQLMTKRKKLQLGEDAPIDFTPDAGVEKGSTDYKGLSDLHDLRFEIHRREINISVDGKTVQELIQIINNDNKNKLEGRTDEDDIDTAYDADQNEEFLIHQPNLEPECNGREDDETLNLDDPDALKDFLEEIPA
jgi:hypothetical protein